MSNSFPRLRRPTQALGLYRPLHRAFIVAQLRWKGISLHRGDRRDGPGLLLRKGRRRVRVKDWDTAAIAIYSFDAMHAAVVPDAFGDVDYSRPRWHRMTRTGEEFYFTSVADLEVDAFYSTYAKALGPGSVVLHVGAYCGVQTVELSRLVGPSGRVFAFEPDAGSFAALELNLAKHGCANAVPLQRGLWREDTVLTFFATEGMHSSFTNAPSHERVETRVEVVAADSMVREHALERVDLLKIDAEGAEFEILKGATQLLRTFDPVVFIDVHEGVDPQLGSKIEAHLVALGYRIRWLDHTPGPSLRFCLAEKTR